MLHNFCLEEAESRHSSGSLCHPGLCSLVSKFSCVFDHLWFIFSMAIFFLNFEGEKRFLRKGKNHMESADVSWIPTVQACYVSLFS